jgi:hypothetical protein
MQGRYNVFLSTAHEEGRAVQFKEGFCRPDVYCHVLFRVNWHFPLIFAALPGMLPQSEKLVGIMWGKHNGITELARNQHENRIRPGEHAGTEPCPPA